MLKNKLELLFKEFTLLKEKISKKLTAKEQSLLETNQLLVEANHKVEELSKENTENEKVLTTLLKEFKELAQQLE